MGKFVLGLDGSLANFGIAVAQLTDDGKDVLKIEDLVLSKTVKTPKQNRALDDFARFKQHWEYLAAIVEDYNIVDIYGEIPTGAQDARAAFAFGGITAMLSGLAINYNVTVVTPAEVKVAATGNKHADKEDVIQATYKAFPNAPWITGKKSNKMNITTPSGLYLTNANEHLADSVGVVLAGLKK